mmetsp:Transcript_45752/g.51198  ORF Transcript_45752/g.51198 Transcript_45752/m.51198 type:complete len:1783 (+) Transcript_45752:215-5563(+)
MDDNPVGLESTSDSEVEGQVATKRNPIIDNEFTDKEMTPVKSSLEKLSTTVSAAKRKQPQEVTDGFENGKRSRLSLVGFARMDNYGPMSAGLAPILTLNEVSRPSSCPTPVPSQGMFDDAEGDETFDIEVYKQPINPIYIRSDLVAAILGSPPKPRASGTGTPPVIVHPNILVKIDKPSQDNKGQKRMANRKAKKKIVTEKERITLVAMLKDKDDLLRILPTDDCNILGKECSIFTLQQLGWVLNDDKNLPDVSSRQKAREMMTQKLKVHLITIKKIEVIKEKDTFQVSEKIKAWKSLIETWKEDGAKVSDVEQFPLDGPLSCFFPTGTLQFIKSVGVKTVSDFLYLKKTESGLVIEMFRAWRKICGLKDMTLHSLAKHLTGINSRIEICFKCEQIAESDSMEWMTGAMIVLTGAAKIFAVDYLKIISATQFVNSKTKILADNLADWRAKNGLTELKGSGTVAMISSWKAQVKEELEIEISEGEIILEQEIRKEIETIMPPDEKQGDEQEKRKKTKTTKSKTNNQSRDNIINKGKTDTIVKIYDIKRISKDTERGGSISKKSVRVPKSNSINPFDALSKSNKIFLATMDISTASLFLATRTTDIANAFINYREDKGMPSLKGLGAVASISGWKKLVRNKAVLNGDLTLAQLNQARNTKIKTAETAVKSANKKLGKTVDSRLGELNALVTKATSKESKDKHKFSVLSTRQNVVFYFEFEIRKYQSREYRRYLRYMGNDPVSIAVDPTVKMNGNAKNVCVPIIVDLDEKSDKMSGRQPYDSLTYGTIELGNLDVQSPKQDDAYGTTLEEVIKAFVLQKKESCGSADDLMPNGEPFPLTGIAKSYVAYPPPANTAIRSDQTRNEGDKSRSTFNMFKLLRDGKQRYTLCQVEPIEKGQSVELCLLPFDIFNKSWLSEENNSKVRKWIQDQLVKLPAQMLLKLFEFLKGDVAKLVLRRFDFVFKGGELSSNVEDTSSCLSMTNVALTIARRRIHWVTVKIHENLQIISGEFARNLSTNLLWTKAFVRKLLDHSYWSLAVSESIQKEIAQEIHDEFSYRGFNGFASTFDLWCPIAKRLFDFTVDLFVGFSGRLESFSSEANLITELCSMVTRSISDLMISSNDLQKHKIRNLLLKFALDYKKGVRHYSKVFPSFEEVTQKCVIEPYEHAMSLCNAPVCKLNSTKDLQIVVLEQVCGSSGEAVSRFQDLKDAKECEKANIDVRWYVDRQILAVIQALIRCGMATFVLENEKECLDNIEAKILETVNLALGETEIQFPSLENFEIHRPRHVAQSMSNDLSEQPDRSSPAPSAGPIFLGFIWPLLKAEGWKLAAGNLPSDILYIPPVETKNQIKNSFVKERSRLFRDASSFGLGYIPKLTKRLFIRCMEEEVAFEKIKECNGKSEETSTKAVMEAFASSLVSKLKKPSDRSTDGFELQKVQGIVSEVLSLFNELVPLTFSNKDKCKLTKGKQWSDILGCRYLLKVLIIVPNVLKDANLPIQQYQRTISVIHELLRFLSENQHDFFGDCFRLPNEEYCTESKFPSSLPSQIKKAITGDSSLKVNNSSQAPDDKDVSIELIHPGDRVNLTDFVTSVMSQAIIGNANVDDVNRQGRIVTGAHPYLVCRHCLGTNGGKYSYSSYESIASAASTIEKHILRCSRIDDEVKQEIITARAYHSEQIKGLPSGAQSDFFKRVYDRLQQSMILCSNESYSDHLAVSDTTIKNTNVFRSHLCVMKFLQSTEPWKSSKPLAEMVDMYYISLEYGGKMYDTNKSNHTFSSEWIYSKLAPKQEY